MKVTLIQMESNGNKIENKAKAFKLLKQATEELPDVICISELFLSWGKDFYGGKVEYSEIDEYQNFAKMHNVNLILGSVALKGSGTNKTTNTCFIIDRNGNIVGKYDKKYMYTVNRSHFKFSEFDDTIPGSTLGIAILDGIKVGIGICYDLRFPEYFRELTKQGVKIVFLPAHFRTETGKITWSILPEARAIENQIYFCACNQTGRSLCGDTKIISYTGEVITRLDKEEGVISAELDIDKLLNYRKEFPALEQMK